MKKLIPSSKIKFNNKLYQIFYDQKGLKYFLRIENDKYIYPTIKECIELSKIYNKVFDGKFYDKKQNKALGYILTIGAEILILYGVIKYSDNIKLVKNQNRSFEIVYENQIINEKVSYDDFIKYIDNSYDLENILTNNKNIDDEFKPYIRLFVEKYSNEDLTLFYYNLSNITITRSSSESISQDTNDSLAVAYFDMFEHKIVIPDYIDLEQNNEVLFHELRHTLKGASIVADNKCLYTCFLSINENNSYGAALMEGMNSKYTSNSYGKQKNYVNMLCLILSEEELKNMEAYKTVDDLINALGQIDGNYEDAKKLIIMMDEELSINKKYMEYENENTIFIYKKLMTYFLIKEQQKLMDSNEFNYMLKYDEFVNNCNEFEMLIQTVYNPYGSNLDDYEQRITNIREVNKDITEMFEELKIEYATPYYEKYNISKEEAENFKTWIFVKTEATEKYLDIDSNKFKIVYTSNIKYKNQNGEEIELHMYELYINKNYLLNGEKEDILNYINEAEYQRTIDSIKEITR